MRVVGLLMNAEPSEGLVFDAQAARQTAGLLISEKSCSDALIPALGLG